MQNGENKPKICRCGSQLECFERFKEGKSIGFFCVECEPWRMITFTDKPDDPEPIKNDV